VTHAPDVPPLAFEDLADAVRALRASGLRLSTPRRLGHTPGLYALAGTHDTEYLHCEGCGRVPSVSPQRLDPVRERIKQDFGYVARFSHFPIVGLCDHCAPPGRA
jgi:Fur family transcriptional regulator, ferric uptake regulator